MGALHAGHLSLAERARRENDSVIATIFVNPTQFGPGEDLATYPRDLPRDLAMFKDAQVDLVFTPMREIMYPPGFQTYVEVMDVAQGLEGGYRPGHFRGVATVVAKLFHLTQPHTAYFGQKDAQQVAVIKQMASDLNFLLDIVVCPTVREPDGLALSSRNVYLSPEHRQAAPVLFKALTAAQDVYSAGERDAERLRQIMLHTLRAEPLAEPEYVSVADAATLREFDGTIGQKALISMAVRIGETRLIDNLLLP
jgi:pantoate--beta-alanine ligase